MRFDSLQDNYADGSFEVRISHHARSGHCVLCVVTHRRCASEAQRRPVLPFVPIQNQKREWVSHESRHTVNWKKEY